MEMDKAFERAALTGQVQQEVIDPITGDVIVVNTETGTYVRTGATAKLPLLGRRGVHSADKRSRVVRGGPAPRAEPGFDHGGVDKRGGGGGGGAPGGANVLGEYDRKKELSVQFNDFYEGSDDEPAVKGGPVKADRRFPPTTGGDGFSPAAGPPSGGADFLPRIDRAAAPVSPLQFPGGGMGMAGDMSALDRLDSPVDTMSTARSEKELEMPVVATTAATLRSTVQNALKYVALVGGDRRPCLTVVACVW